MIAMHLAFRQQARMIPPPLAMGATMYRALLLSASLFVSTAAVAGDVAQDPADYLMQRKVLEAILRQTFSGTMDVLYKNKLDKDVAGETAIPGLHAAMISSAKSAGTNALEEQLLSAGEETRSDLHKALTAKQVDRLAFLYEPYVKRNADVKIAFGPDDTSATAVMQRSLNALTKGPEYQVRLRQISAEAGMAQALNVNAAVTENYGKRLLTGFGQAVKAAFQAAHSKANELAAAKGFAAPYPNSTP